MNEKRFLVPASLLMLFAVTSCKQINNFEVSNPLNEDIIDKAIVVSRSEVNSFLEDTTMNLIVIVKSADGDTLPSQCDDLNGDGKWDELVFLCDFKAGEKKTIFFEPFAAQPEFPVRTNIRFGRMEKPFAEVAKDLRMKTNDTKFTAPVYQMEGPAWENDVIAFRNYYDARNGIDIFGKTTDAMVMDSVGVNGREYHTLADWGMDILKVGNSLGAGAIAIGIGDSVYRVGPCSEGHYRLVTEGPVRAILELTYKDIPAGDRFYNVKHEISIYAGDRFYRSRVWIDGLKGDEELVTGIVNLHMIPADTLSADSRKILFSLGNQGFSGELLGMGVLIPSTQFKRIWEAPLTGTGIVNTHLVSLQLNRDTPAEYRFLAAWETQDAQVKDMEYFKGLLKEAAIR